MEAMCHKWRRPKLCNAAALAVPQKTTDSLSGEIKNMALKA
jgi:hypothetical protein